MSEDSGGQRRAGRGGGRDDADARPVTAAGRRRRAEGSAEGSGSPGATAGKGTATPTRDRPDAARASAVARLQRFLREVVAELRKVHWPTRRQLVVYTAVVLVFVAFMISLVALLDYAFAKVVFALFG